ncbi:hypothetical protein TNIN_192611 [Trichonephila inaurata madagascariensis]|uniref:Uncharacterized protein n=1 Tax=Trichonephila inaurata madagascariensis TaxID=2747483 RepID=A0A8X6YYE8_9ARAC|nr:hypothetical protein TNIN_192611 [Trichonephila inaurata madagascariensis]
MQRLSGNGKEKNPAIYAVPRQRTEDGFSLCLLCGCGMVAVQSRRHVPVFTIYPKTVPCRNLEGNNITVIRADDFEGLNQVQIMQLMENQIHLIEKGAFQDLVSMERLRLNNNRLRSLPDLLFSTMPNLLRL